MQAVPCRCPPASSAAPHTCEGWPINSVYFYSLRAKKKGLKEGGGGVCAINRRQKVVVSRGRGEDGAAGTVLPPAAGCAAPADAARAERMEGAACSGALSCARPQPVGRSERQRSGFPGARAMLHGPAAMGEPWQPQPQQQRLPGLGNASEPSAWPGTAAPGSGGGGGGAGAGAGGTVNPWDIALCATGTAVAGENALVLAVLFYTPSLRAPMFLLIGSLALADLLAGLGLVANFAVRYLLRPPSEAAELGAAGLLLAAFSASVCSLLAITVDRYLSLYNALTYHSERTLGFTCAMVLLMWLLCLGVGLLPLLGWNCLRDQSACSILRPVTKDNAAVLAVTFLLLFALMMQLYLQICKIAFRHAQQIAVQHQFIATAQATSTRKGLSTLSLILGTFALCWIPFAIYSLVADSSYPVVYTYSLALPATCNSLINPIIYAFRNPDIQKSLWLACCGCIPSTFSSRPRTSSDV
ncbi:G-protein coupled receptor 12-like isoform X1 [Pezoporus wallicus]|uniref:G-protein coupled receptor 12-like isoform X1 n=1 Tax=Pezoporus wallicus TaxID=35540 RepID=UPI00254A1A5A|nr:G-protein coupled receptor 12-like isoform X1 [Pezoporus wallicus]